MPILEIFVGYFFGSLINDLIVRGYIFGLLKDKIHIGWVSVVSILIYALDDYWYAGFSLSNIIFSIILGLSLTLAFYKTGSIWADTGIHYGLNMAYGLLFGLVGNPESAIVSIKETGRHPYLSTNLQYTISAILFIFLFWLLKYYSINHNRHINNKVPFSA
ncbi:CPBP family intramembrane metalloprotease [Neobacillus cucumis]|uniref:CPBP family intramembrane glutamic endopeptidase n=1 Tax=Neobacillus cucumis TaxID=1740721 RepID=UPI00203AE2EA|nr:CPBP family intramembrane glutamic endopeptidase [Neobacillus cucumis]MCM3729437.1 CPBP family intramembrane metalloprotease [Neobacillus cucumis]